MAADSIKPLSWGRPTINLLAGDRLHLNHGPIDLIIRAEGEKTDVKAAYAAAVDRFQTVLSELVKELPQLRQQLRETIPDLRGFVAQRMVQACWPYRRDFITPMAAVAGSVADEMKAIMLAASPKLQTLFINNGGDIALFVAEGAQLRIGLVADIAAGMPEGFILVNQESGIGGVATSGWRGRSFSRGIADAVTVLARTAAQADAAATIIANAVDVVSPHIQRSAAHSLDIDSDLGGISVTTGVAQLQKTEVEIALSSGERIARALLQSSQIQAYFIALQGRYRLGESVGLSKNISP
jgi:uncharacterized protein